MFSWAKGALFQVMLASYRVAPSQAFRSPGDGVVSYHRRRSKDATFRTSCWES